MNVYKCVCVYVSDVWMCSKYRVCVWSGVHKCVVCVYMHIFCVCDVVFVWLWYVYVYMVYVWLGLVASRFVCLSVYMCGEVCTWVCGIVCEYVWYMALELTFQLTQVFSGNRISIGPHHIFLQVSQLEFHWLPTSLCLKLPWLNNSQQAISKFNMKGHLGGSVGKASDSWFGVGSWAQDCETETHVELLSGSTPGIELP